MLKRLGVYLLCVTLVGSAAACSSMSPERERDCLIGAGAGALVAGGVGGMLCMLQFRMC